ncbi:MAG: transposase [Opitutales bacterium]|nr:transposase [Opitutales bacterium]
MYHLFGRVVHKRRILGEAERDAWVRALHRAAVFSGVELITYCVLGNHFHILARVDPEAKACGDGELVRRFRALYGESKAQWCALDADALAHALAHDPPETAERLRERLRARMGDVPEFMRTLRQRYTKWYNRTHDTVGTLWAERFGSVLVQDLPWFVALVAAYIDLNPVREGLSALPEDYRWSGYAAALAGHADLRAALAGCFPREGNEAAALAAYRLLMLGKGAKPKAGGSGCVDRAALLEAVRCGGELALHELLQLRARFMTRGRAMGTVEWMRTGTGGAALARLRKPPQPVPVEVLDGEELAVAHRWMGAGGLGIPNSEYPENSETP